MKDCTGFTGIPDHYAGEREAIDIIRDALGDDGFVAFCLGNAIKYRLRAGKKGPIEEDIRKAEWYEAMRLHVLRPQGHPDPRAGRPGFVPYVSAYVQANVDRDQVFRLGKL